MNLEFVWMLSEPRAERRAELELSHRHTSALGDVEYIVLSGCGVIRRIWTPHRYATLVVCKLEQLHHSARISIVSRGYEYVVNASAIARALSLGYALQQHSKGLHLP